MKLVEVALGYLDDLTLDDVLKSVLMAILKASANRTLRDVYHNILDDLDDDKELTFALMQQACARQFRRVPDRECSPDNLRSDRATPRTSPAKPDIKYLRQSSHGPEPYNKYTRQGAQDGGPAAYLCTYLDNHGVKPEKVLKKAGLTGTYWDDPSSVNALYVASHSPASSSLTHARRMDGFCNQNAEQLGYLAGLSLLTRRTVPSNCICRCSRMRARLPLHILFLHTQVSR
jgi:hypothetical protein